MIYVHLILVGLGQIELLGDPTGCVSMVFPSETFARGLVPWLVCRCCPWAAPVGLVLS